MADYRISNVAKEDLIRIHQYGVKKFGMAQADKYSHSFISYFEIIAQQAYSFEAVDYIKKGYRRCVCVADSIYYRIDSSTNTVEIMTITRKQDLNSVFKN